MIKVSIEKLKDLRACEDGIKFWIKGNTDDLEEQIIRFEEIGRLEDINWLIPRLLSKVGAVKYAVYASESVLHIYEKKIPQDDIPRKAIEAAKEYIKEPTEENISKAYAVRPVCNAHYAASAAYYAASAAYYAAYAARAVAYGVRVHSDKKRISALKTFINYGVQLLKEELEND